MLIDAMNLSQCTIVLQHHGAFLLHGDHDAVFATHADLHMMTDFKTS